MANMRRLGFWQVAAVLVALWTAPLCRGADVWTNLELYGGAVFDVTIDPNQPDKIFAGTYLGGGLYLSENGGGQWTPVETNHLWRGEDTFTNHVVWDVKIAPTDTNPDNNVVWAVHNQWAEVSRDGGQTWTHIFNRDMQRDCTDCGGIGDDFRFNQTIVISPDDPDTVYIGTGGVNGSYSSGAVYKTLDGGATWAKMNQGIDFARPVDDMAISPANPDVLYLVTTYQDPYTYAFSGRLYRSDDGGVSWQTVSVPYQDYGGMLSVAVKPDDENVVFLGSAFGLYRLEYDPDADNWLVGYPIWGLPETDAYGNTIYPHDSALVTDIVFDPQDPDIVYAAWQRPTFYSGDGRPKISRSTDGGLTFVTHTLEGSGVTKLESLAVHPIDGNILFAGDAALGVFTSIDAGVTWSPVNTGLNAVVVYDVAVSPHDRDHFLVGTGSGMFHRRGAGPWINLTTGLCRSVAFHPSDPLSFYGGNRLEGYAGYLWRTSDGGLTGEDRPVGWYVGVWADIHDIAVGHDAAHPLYVGLSSFVASSTDNGDTFSPILNATDHGHWYQINKIAVDPNDPQHLWAGGGLFYQYRTNGDLWESLDSGATWSRNSLSDKQIIVNDILIDPTNSDTIYIGNGFSGGSDAPVYRSDDGGISWQAAFQGIPPQIYRIAAVGGAGAGQRIVVAYSSKIRHYSGNGYVEYDADANNPGMQIELEAVWGSAADNVYAVGANAAMLHFDGNAWTHVTLPTGVNDHLNSIWGLAADSIFAAGYGGTVLHYDGAQWADVSTGSDDGINGIWCASDTNIFIAANGGTLRRFNGSAWIQLAVPTTANMNAIWGSGPNDIYAVGSNGTIIHWDGATWSIQNTPTDRALHAVWGTGPDNVYAMGHGATVLHSDGSGIWTAVSNFPVDDPHLIMAGAYGEFSDDITFVDDRGGVYHYDGSQFRIISFSGSDDNAVVGLAFHPASTQTVYAATHQAGVFLSPDQGDFWLKLGEPIYAVFSIATSSLYAGTQGGLLQCHGTGVIAGSITSAASGALVDGALVYNDLGAHSYSIGGEYMMVSPAGFCSVTAAADGHQATTERNITLLGGDIEWVDIEMGSGVSGAGGTTPGNTVINTASGGGYCFITTASDAVSYGAFLNCWGACLGVLAVLALISFARLRSVAKGGRFFLLFYVLIALVLWSIPADEALAGTLFQQVGIAGSPNPVGSGARAQGMGGAFIAVADDATAASWNPAGLIQLEKPEWSIVGAYRRFQEDFASDVRPEIDNSGDTSDTSVNYFSVTLPFHWHRNMVLSLSYQQLYQFQRDFSHRLNLSSGGLDVAQVKNFRQEGDIGALGLAGAIELSPTLSLGVTLNLWTDQLLWENGWKEDYTDSSTGTQGGAPVAIETVIQDEYSQFRGINANLGLLYSPVPALTIGAVIKTPFKASLRHEYHFEQAVTFTTPGTTTTSSQETVEDVFLEMPLSYGIGVAWRVSDALTLDADIYRTHWSDYTLEDDAGNRFSPIDGNLERQSDVDDTTQFRIGAEYLMLFPEKRIAVPLRCGLYYDPEPASESAKDFFGVALGSGIAWKNLVFDIAYNYRWGRGVDAGNLIATSEADVGQHTVLASLIYHFD